MSHNQAGMMIEMNPDPLIAALETIAANMERTTSVPERYHAELMRPLRDALSALKERPAAANPLRCLYFGCWVRAGHYLWEGDGRSILREYHDFERKICYDWHIDGGLCPLPKDGEGVAVHHRDGWTIVAFWDRTVDDRGACNSAFLVDALVSGEECIRTAQQQFPAVWQRVKHLVEPYIPTERRAE